MTALAPFLHPYVGLWKSLAITFLVCLLMLLAPAALKRWLGAIEAAGARFARKPWLVLALMFLAPAAIRLALLPLMSIPVPGGHDEQSYMLAADTFAHGRLTNPTHPLWMSFETFHVNWQPTYHSIFPPAQGMFLALGQILGNPWIGVVLSVAAMCASVVWMLQAWMPARWALLGGLMTLCNLGIVSYWMNSFWGGAVAAIGGALILGALPRLLRRPSVFHSFLMGLGMAVLANSRPLEGFIFCIPVAVVLAVGLLRSRPSPVSTAKVLAPLGTMLLLTVVFAGYYNWRTTGHVTVFPHLLNFRTYFRAPLFIWQGARPPIHYNNPEFESFYNGAMINSYHRTWTDLARETWHKLSLTCSVFLWTGAIPLLLAFPLVLRDRRIRLLLAEFGLCAAGLFSIVYFEPHYAAPLTCVIYGLLVQALRHLRTVRFLERPAGVDLARAVIVLLLFTAVSAPYHLIRYPKSPDPWSWNRGGGVKDPVVERVQALPGPQLVIVRYAPGHNPNAEWVYNQADIDHSKVVWARELGPEQNQKLVTYFHDRQIWLFEPDAGRMRLRPYPVTPGAH
jgi:hypothetical protein